MIKDITKKYKLFEPGNKKRRANLAITEIALLKMIGLIESFDGEVGWHGTAVKKNKMSFTIEDIFVYPQDATPASIDTDQSGYEQWLYRQPNEVFTKMRMHGHSHCNFGVTPSSKDDNHRNGIVGQLVDDMFYVFMIWNKAYKFSILLYDCEADILYDHRGIDVFVLLGDKSIPLKKIKAADIKTKLSGDKSIKAFLAEAKNVVRIREDKNALDTMLIRDNDLFSILSKHTGQNIRLLAEVLNGKPHVLKFITANGREILRLSGSEDSISLVWSVAEVQSIRPDLTDYECMDVLKRVRDKHDTSLGVSWDTIEIRADELYPKPNDAKIYGRFVKNEIAKRVAANSCRNIVCIFENHMILSGHEIRIKVDLLQDIEPKRLFHHWYGDCVVSLKISVDGKEMTGEIIANGNIRAHLYDKEDNALCDVKDRGNKAAFFDMSRYIPDDRLLDALLNHKDNEQGLSLQVEDSNWWELFPGGIDSVVLSDYSLIDAIGEAVEVLYMYLESEDGNESE